MGGGDTVIMSYGTQGSTSQGQQQSEGQSIGKSESASDFGSTSTQESTGRSAGQSTGQSTASGTSGGQSFGFSGLSPTDSAALSSSLGSALTGQVLPSLTSSAGATYNLPALNAQGLYPAQQAAADKAIEDAIAGLSSSAAARGQLDPRNVSAVSGAAIQNVLPQLMPVISQNIKDVAGAPLALATGRTQAISPLLQSLAGLLGSQQQSTQAAQNEAQSTQAAMSESEQLSRALAQSFGTSQSKSFQEALSKSLGTQLSNSFGFGLGII